MAFAAVVLLVLFGGWIFWPRKYPPRFIDTVFPAPAQVAAIIGAAELWSVPPSGYWGEMYGDDIVDNDCVGVRNVATERFYLDFDVGWLKVSKSLLISPLRGQLANSSDQAVVEYPNPSVAQDFYATAVQTWRHCAGRTINAAEVDRAAAQQPGEFWTVGPVFTADDVLTVTLTRRQDQPWQCRRALAAHAEFVIDVDACGAGVPGAAAAGLVRMIADDIDDRR